MSLLNITKVSDTGSNAGALCCSTIMALRSLEARKACARAKSRPSRKRSKFEGPAAAIAIEGAAKPEGPAWVLAKADSGWHVRFTLVELTAFELFLKPDEAAGSPTAAEQSVKAVKDCLAHADIHWDPPEADPAYQEKVPTKTEIEGIPGSGPQISAAMQEKLNEFAKWALVQVPVLEDPVLLVLDYSPSMEQPPLSIAFDCGSGPKCWMTASKVRKIDDKAPNYHDNYREFLWEGRQFKPYSIQNLSGAIFEDINALQAACRQLYQHVEWE